MPLPIRANSTRITNANEGSDTRNIKALENRSWQPLSESKNESRTANGSVSDDTELSASSAKLSVDGAHAISRIPSPLKTTHLNQSHRDRPATAIQPKQQLSGHSRQRSIVAPALSNARKLGHGRSASTVSTTTTSTSSNEKPKPATRINATVTSRKNEPRIPRGKVQPQSRVAPNTSISRTSLTSGQAESLKSECLQLSLVHAQSVQAFLEYQRSIDSILLDRHNRLHTIQKGIRQEKKTLSVAVNIQALDNWSQQSGVRNKSQHLQDLSLAVRDLSRLYDILEGEEGLSAAFYDWQQTADPRSEATDNGVGLEEGMLMQRHFEEELRPQLSHFQQKVASCLASLSNLPDAMEGSSLAFVIKKNTILAQTLIALCETMLQIGERIISNHAYRFAQEIKLALTELDQGSPKATLPVWDP